MTVTSRWVRYPVAGTTQISSALAGERGKVRATADVGDTMTINASANQIKVNFEAIGDKQITLTSGTLLAGRFVARDIERKLQAHSASGAAYEYANCEFSNYKSGNGESHFFIKSGTITASAPTIAAGDADARTVLGFSSSTGEAGTTYHTGTSTSNSAYGGTVTASGTYGGMFDEEYYLIVNEDVLVEDSAGGGNGYAGSFVGAGD